MPIITNLKLANIFKTYWNQNHYIFSYGTNRKPSIIGHYSITIWHALLSFETLITWNWTYWDYWNAGGIHSWGLFMLVVIVLLRVIWAAVAYLQSNNTTFNQYGMEPHTAWVNTAHILRDYSPVPKHTKFMALTNLFLELKS